MVLRNKCAEHDQTRDELGIRGFNVQFTIIGYQSLSGGWWLSVVSDNWSLVKKIEPVLFYTNPGYPTITIKKYKNGMGLSFPV